MTTMTDAEHLFLESHTLRHYPVLKPGSTLYDREQAIEYIWSMFELAVTINPHLAAAPQEFHTQRVNSVGVCYEIILRRHGGYKA